MPMVCGSRSQVLNAAPPLKSMRMKVSRVGSLRAASPATIERRNSLLPEPVVPPTRPCGPSRTRSMPKHAVLADAERGRDAGVGGRPAAADGGGVRPRRCRAAAGSRTSAGSEAPGIDSSGSSNRARSRRAARGASSTPMPGEHDVVDGEPVERPGDACRPRRAPTWMTVVQAAGSCSSVAAMTMPETWVSGAAGRARPAAGGRGRAASGRGRRGPR